MVHVRLLSDSLLAMEIHLVFLLESKSCSWGESYDRLKDLAWNLNLDPYQVIWWRNVEDWGEKF